MEEEKDIGLEVLTEQVVNMTGLIKNRNNLLQAMFKSDLEQDFLMQEAAQGGTGGAGVEGSVSPTGGMGGIAPNLMLPTPALPDRKEYVNVEEASGSGNIGGASPNGSDMPTEKFNKGAVVGSSVSKPKVGSVSDGFSPTDKPSTKSLEETGFDDTFEKNISNNLEKDFKVDERLKKAFGGSLALPLKAAAVGLIGLLAKIPFISPSIVTNVDNFIRNIGSGMGIFTSTSVDNATNEKIDGEENNIFKKVANFFGFGKEEKSQQPVEKVTSSTEKPMVGGGTGGGGIVSTISNFFGLAKDRDHQVAPTTMMGGVVNNLQKRRQLIDAFGSGNMPVMGVNQGGTFGGLTNIMNDMSSSMSNIQSSGSFQDVSKSLVTNMSSIANSDSTKSIISDLTNTVINENSTLMNEMGGSLEGLQEEMTGIIKKAGAAIPNLKTESGGTMAISTVKQSPFFSEYANTAQFT